MQHVAKLYQSNALVKVCPVSKASYTRRANNAGSGSLTVKDGAVADRVSLWRDNVRIYSGDVTNIDTVNQDLTKYTLAGHEIRLRRHLCPRNYKGWDGMDLADFARDVIHKFGFRRWSTDADFALAVDSLNVSLSEQVDNVMLAREAHPLIPGAERYVAEGYIVFRLDTGAAGILTGRIVRWTEVVGTTERIYVQSRTASTEAGLASATWSAEATAVHADDVADNEGPGLPLEGGGRWLEVKFILRTEDQSTPDDALAPTIYGFTPQLQGLEVLWREATEVLAGAIPASSGITISGLTFDRINLLECLSNVGEAYEQDFFVDYDESDGTYRLNFGALGEDHGVDSADPIILREGVNCEITQHDTSMEDKANVLHCWGAGSGADQLYTVLRDEDSIALYGERHADFEDQDCETIADLVEKATTQFNLLRYPELSFQVRARADLHTGDTTTVYRRGAQTTPPADLPGDASPNYKQVDWATVDGWAPVGSGSLSVSGGELVVSDANLGIWRRDFFSAANKTIKMRIYADTAHIAELLGERANNTWGMLAKYVLLRAGWNIVEVHVNDGVTYSGLMFRPKPRYNLEFRYNSDIDYSGRPTN